MRIYLRKTLFFAVMLLEFAIGNNANASFFSKDDFAVALGAEYLSQLERRGIIVYKGYQVFPIYSVDLFNPDLQLVGSSLNYRWRLDSQALTLRTRLSIDSTNDSPLYETKEKKTDRIRRTSTSEVEGFLEWRALSYMELSASISQDIGAHGGTHGEVGTRLILGNFVQREERGAMIQPALFGTLGLATKRHNEYLYGNGAEKGLSHYTFGFSVSSPAVIDTFYPVLKISRFGLLGNKNRSAAFVRSDEKDSWQILALAAFRVW
jgi:hypothetical protein